MLRLENISKSHGEKILFSNLHTIIRENDRIGLIGPNGTGKSTLLKIIAGQETADDGELIHAKDFTVAYLPQEERMEEDKTVIDYIFQSEVPMMRLIRSYEQISLSLEQNPQDENIQQQLLRLQEQMDAENAWDAQTVVQTVLSKLGITFYNKNVQHLSGGQKKRVALAKALIEPADLLILDEPTNHLDNVTIQWLEQFLANYRGALLIVTHDRYFLNRVTNYIYELDHGQLYTYEGNYETFVEKKMIRQEEERIAEQKHKNRLRNEMEWLKRGARARSTKQRARIERIQQMQERTFHKGDEQIEIQVGASKLGSKVIELENASKKINERTLWESFSFIVTPDSRIGIIGPNGAGKSTLLDVIAGRLKVDSGTVTIGETVKIGYYKQGEEELDPNMRIIEYIKEVAEVITTVDGIQITAEQMLERFLFSRYQQWGYIKSLSGGERRRLYLLKILMTEPNVLLLDEPTNDLDIQTLTILEEYIEQFPGVVMTVSHDRYFLDRIADMLLVVDGKGAIDIVYGNYTDYMEKTVEETRELKRQQKEQKEKAPTPKKKKLSYLEQKEWESIEDEIAALEAEAEAIEAAINEAGNDIEKVQQLYEAQQEKEQEMEEKMERWEELSLLVEALEE